MKHGYLDLICMVPDFPKAGVRFYDLTPVFAHAPSFQALLDDLAEPWKNEKVDFVIAPESRGFIVGAPLAERLGAGFIPARKAGKLPRATVSASLTVEYRSGGEELFIHEDAIPPGARVLLVDDVLATGGTAGASYKLVKKVGAELVGASFVVEIGAFTGRGSLPKGLNIQVLKRL